MGISMVLKCVYNYLFLYYNEGGGVRPAKHLFSILYYFCASRERYYGVMFDDLAVFICWRHRIKEEKSKKNNISFRYDSRTTRAHTMLRCIYVLHTHVKLLLYTNSKNLGPAGPPIISIDSNPAVRHSKRVFTSGTPLVAVVLDPLHCKTECRIRSCRCVVQNIFVCVVWFWKNHVYNARHGRSRKMMYIPIPTEILLVFRLPLAV